MIVRPGSTFALGTWVMEQAAVRFRVSPWDLILNGGARTDERARARWAVIWVLRQLTDGQGRKKFTVRDIGRLLGYSDHTTISHGTQQAEALRASDPDFQSKTSGLLAQVGDFWRPEE